MCVSGMRLTLAPIGLIPSIKTAIVVTAPTNYKRLNSISQVGSVTNSLYILYPSVLKLFFIN